MGSRESIKIKERVAPTERSEALGRALRVLAAQVRISLEDSEAPYNELTALFAEIAQSEWQQYGENKSEPCFTAEDFYGQAVIAFQFYDRMCQRLATVQDSLVCLAQYLDDEAEHLISPERLLVEHEALYSSLQMERLLCVMHGKELEDNKQAPKRSGENAAMQSDVELF